MGGLFFICVPQHFKPFAVFLCWGGQEDAVFAVVFRRGGGPVIRARHYALVIKDGELIMLNLMPAVGADGYASGRQFVNQRRFMPRHCSVGDNSHRCPTTVRGNFRIGYGIDGNVNGRGAPKFGNYAVFAFGAGGKIDRHICRHHRMARRQNMLSMRWSNVDLNLGFVLFPDSKNGDPQRIPLISQALEILQDMRTRATDDWVFSSRAGSKSGHVEDFHRPWYALLKRANIENLRFHDLRRTFGSYQAITGASLHIVGKALGDKTSAATKVYARLTMAPVRDSIQRAADKMLEFVDV